MPRAKKRTISPPSACRPYDLPTLRPADLTTCRPYDLTTLRPDDLTTLRPLPVEKRENPSPPPMLLMECRQRPGSTSFPVSPNRLNINNTPGLPVTCRAAHPVCSEKKTPLLLFSCLQLFAFPCRPADLPTLRLPPRAEKRNHRPQAASISTFCFHLSAFFVHLTT